MKLPPEHFRQQAEQQQQQQNATRLGEKLMQQMGWEKGQGLGKEGQGRKEHIRGKKKENAEGGRARMRAAAIYISRRLCLSVV